MRLHRWVGRGGVQGLAVGKRQAPVGDLRPTGRSTAALGIQEAPSPAVARACENVVTPSGSGRQHVRSVDREEDPIPRREKDDPRSECRWPKGGRNPGHPCRPLRRRSWITGRIGRCPTRKGADAGQVSLCGNTDDGTGTEGQVGRHDDDADGDVCRGRCGERTGGTTTLTGTRSIGGPLRMTYGVCGSGSSRRAWWNSSCARQGPGGDRHGVQR
jgi:hypothetical protein